MIYVIFFHFIKSLMPPPPYNSYMITYMKYMFFHIFLLDLHFIISLGYEITIICNHINLCNHIPSTSFHIFLFIHESLSEFVYEFI